MIDQLIPVDCRGTFPEHVFGLHADQLPPEIVGWMVTLQQTIQDSVSEDDIKEIVANQVKRAKAGDKQAIDFVFKQLMGGDAFKGATFVQNNNYGEDPAKPLKQGSPKDQRIETLRRRAEAHLPMNQNGDGEEPEHLRD